MEHIISYFGEYTAGVDGALSTFKFEYLTSLGFAAIVIFVGSLDRGSFRSSAEVRHSRSRGFRSDLLHPGCLA